MTMRKAAILPLVAALALAACNNGPEQKPIEDNVVEVENVTDNVDAAMPPPAVNATNASNVTEKTAPKPDFTDEQQMKDDADATGMTSRLPDEAPASGNETAPVK
jgi:hypothetical protein